jgi:hypothetical protein
MNWTKKKFRFIVADMKTPLFLAVGKSGRRGAAAAVARWQNTRLVVLEVKGLSAAAAAGSRREESDRKSNLAIVIKLFSTSSILK